MFAIKLIPYYTKQNKRKEKESKKRKEKKTIKWYTD